MKKLTLFMWFSCQENIYLYLSLVYDTPFVTAGWDGQRDI